MRKLFVLPFAALTLALAPVVPASAAPPPTQVIVLPGATSVEPIAAGRGTTFYTGDMFAGDIYRGDIRRGTAELFIDVPQGTQTVGMAFDAHSELLFVAGDSGKAYVYSTRTRSLVRTYQLGDTTAGTLINGVTMTPFGAWFTDSVQPKLYFIPNVFGHLGPARILNLSGPAAGKPGEFHLNGITSTPSGSTLLVAPATGELCTINPITGTSKAIADIVMPATDSLLLEGRRLWTTSIFDNQVVEWRLHGDFSSGSKVKVIKDPNFAVPLGIAKFGNRLAVANSHLDTGLPPTNPTYEVIVVNA